jgi:proteic killer suppression protein
VLGKGVYSIKVSGQWRITYEIENDGAVIVDYQDYRRKQIKARK